MNFEESIPFLFAQISTSFKVALEKSMEQIELHGGQVFILFELWKSDGQSQIEIARKLNVSAPTINKMVKSLAANGFVNCRRNKDDGRIVRVFLTSKANEVRPKVEEQWKKLEQLILINLTETEKLVLFQLYVKLKDNLLPIKAE